MYWYCFLYTQFLTLFVFMNGKHCVRLDVSKGYVYSEMLDFEIFLNNILKNNFILYKLSNNSIVFMYCVGYLHLLSHSDIEHISFIIGLKRNIKLYK